MRSRGTFLPRRTFSRKGITSSRFSGPPKETIRSASYWDTSLSLTRVWMSAQSGQCAVNLFGQYHAREFVRHRQGRKRQQQVGSLPPGCRKSVGAADNKNQI